MKLRIDKAGRTGEFWRPLLLTWSWRRSPKPDDELEAVERPEGVLLKRVEQRPSMVKADGLWVHQGSAEAGANWDRNLDGVREERLKSLLKA